MITKPFRQMTIFCLIVCMLLLALNGCNFVPAEEEEEEDNSRVQTAAAETVQANNAQLTITAQEALLTSQAQTLQAPPEQPPVETEPPSVPVETEAPPAGAEPPAAPVETEPPPPPPGEPLRVIADVETNCREGPSPDYPRVSYLLVGQEAPALGQNPQRTWWLIEDPQRPGQACWVWGETTRLVGDPDRVEIVEPPPPPVADEPPNFDAAFENIHDCGVAMAFFWVGVNSPHTFRSSRITMKNLSNNQIFSGPEDSNQPFVANAGACPPGFNSLGMGGAAYVFKGLGMVLPPGTPTRAIIVLCTEPNQGGECVEKKVNFNFP